MQTSFSLAQLADPNIKDADGILRNCVHCGFCTATCPTYVLLGDELDSPRGRIYLIKNMLEGDAPTAPDTVRHVDRCLSCLSCMTTCPSGVHYMHLVDHARAHIEETYRRPLAERVLRGGLAWLMPVPGRFRLGLRLATLARPFAALLPGRLGTALRLTPARVPPAADIDRPQTIPAIGPRRRRVAMLNGCVQTVLEPAINEATVRLLTRHGCEVVVADGAGCCGSLVLHLGKNEPALEAARANIDAWKREIDGAGLDAIIVNASGCGTTIKDYGYMLRLDEDYAGAAAEISALARDVSEFMAELGLKKPAAKTGQTVAYHAACSLQHGQGVRRAPVDLLSAAGFKVREPAEAHLCCGSAGTYNILQSKLAEGLLLRKVEHLNRLEPEIIATGNIGCLVQLSAAAAAPVVHTVELLDWATGGPKPKALGPNRHDPKPKALGP